MKKILSTALGLTLALSSSAQAEEMDKLWNSGEKTIKLRAKDAERGQLFDEGNYAMFIHWGLYSQLGNKVDGKTYYGIGEWIMNPRMAGISVEDYKTLATTFNPTSFNAKEIVQLAKDAGMKYIIITSKHHDGFAMYDSKANDFNITKATPWGIDPMKELVKECEAAGIGFGFYYSHNQDWTYPGGNGGPEVDAEGNAKDFDDYFYEKCLPQVEEITSEYGKIELVWFDTPGKMDKKYVQELVDVVRKNQPNALVSGRAGHNLGDYQSLGDMEVPHSNVEGLWEAVDTTNDSWAYAWYDEYWKTPKEVLKRTIACVARGGTYMLNIGPDSMGAVPERAKTILRESGAWIKNNPSVIYNAGASPYGHALPWGDVTTQGNTLQLCVLEWPRDGKLYLPGLENTVQKVHLVNGGERQELSFVKDGSAYAIDIPAAAPDKLASVILVELDGEPKADKTFALDPELKTTILTDFATKEGAVMHERHRWMEKFGEWKVADILTKWGDDGHGVFEIEVLKAGDYNASLTYTGEGRLVWGVEVEGGERIQNEQNSSHNYQEFPMGWINFPKPGKYTIKVSCVEGGKEKAALNALHLEPMVLSK